MSIYSCSKKRTSRRQSYKEERLRRRHRRQQKLNCYAKTNEDQEYEYRLVPDEIYPNRTFKRIKVRKKPTIIVVYER